MTDDTNRKPEADALEALKRECLANDEQYYLRFLDDTGTHRAHAIVQAIYHLHRTGRLNTAPAPSEDRQRALYAFEMIVENDHGESGYAEGWLHGDCIKTIRAALSTPRPPMIEGLREAYDSCMEFGPLYPALTPVLEAARWYADEMEGRYEG